MTPPQPPTNQPDDGDAQQSPGSGDPATDPTRVWPANQQYRNHGQHAFGVQSPAPGVPPQPGLSPRDPQAQSEPGYGWQTLPGYGPPPGPGYWPQTGPGYGGPPGYGQGGYGQQPSYGPPPYVSGGYRQPGGPSGQQIARWITLGVVVFLGLLGAILTLTLLMDVTSAVSRASEMCDQYGGPFSDICKESLRDNGVDIPMAAVIYLVLMILGSLAALGGALLILLKKHFGQFLILGGGVMMLLFAIICAAQYGGAGRITYDLIAGMFIAIVGGLLLVPQIRLFLGLPPISGNSRRPDQFGGGGQQPYGQPYPGQYGQPGSGGYPPQQW